MIKRAKLTEPVPQQTLLNPANTFRITDRYASAHRLEASIIRRFRSAARLQDLLACRKSVGVGCSRCHRTDARGIAIAALSPSAALLRLELSTLYPAGRYSSAEHATTYVRITDTRQIAYPPSDLRRRAANVDART